MTSLARRLGFVLALAATGAVPGPAAAQMLGRSMTNGLGEADLAAIGPVVQQILREDKPGAVRPWTSPNGDAGNVRLLSGGAASGETCGSVRMSTVRGGVEARGYKFKYCLDAHKVWRVAG